MKYKWKVVPLSHGQLTDINEQDIVENGLYRICDIYKGGGGYDRFTHYLKRKYKLNPNNHHKQFIVQLFACPLDCPYCYVTRQGVWGDFVEKTTDEIVYSFLSTELRVFHLMGGAPALYMTHWVSLIKELYKNMPNVIFHSDFMLCENYYNEGVLKTLKNSKCCQLYAINIKGLTPKEWQLNTRKEFDSDRFWYNWLLLQELKIPCYITFTGVKRKGLPEFWELAKDKGIDINFWKDKSYVIPIINYNAIKYVDSIPWANIKIEDNIENDICHVGT